MDRWWWYALAAVAAVAMVATLVDGWGRGAPPRRGDRQRRGELRRGTGHGPVVPERPGAPVPDGPAGAGAPGVGVEPGPGPGPGGRGDRPRAGEIWWAAVRSEDGRATEDRPCLVLSIGRGTALVARITGSGQGRPAVIALPPGSLGEARQGASYLASDELRRVPLRGFRRRVGAVDPAVWTRVRHLAD